MDSLLLSSGLPFNMAESANRNYSVIERMLEMELDDGDIGASRKLKGSSPSEREEKVNGGESVLKKTQRDLKGVPEKKVVMNHRVSEEDLK